MLQIITLKQSEESPVSKSPMVAPTTIWMPQNRETLTIFQMRSPAQKKKDLARKRGILSPTTHLGDKILLIQRIMTLIQSEEAPASKSPMVIPKPMRTPQNRE